MLWNIVILIGILLFSLSLKLVYYYVSNSDSASFLDYFYLGNNFEDIEAPQKITPIFFTVCNLVEIICLFCMLNNRMWAMRGQSFTLFEWVWFGILLFYIFLDIVANVKFAVFSTGRTAEPTGPVKRFFERKNHYKKRAAHVYGVTEEEFEKLETEAKEWKKNQKK